MKEDLPMLARFDIKGSNLIETVKYDSERITINETQYFDKIPTDVWNYSIGGYQVLLRWLKSRSKSGKVLSRQEIEHFVNIVAVVVETFKIQKTIDRFRIF